MHLSLWPLKDYFLSSDHLPNSLTVCLYREYLYLSCRIYWFQTCRMLFLRKLGKFEGSINYFSCWPLLFSFWHCNSMWTKPDDPGQWRCFLSFFQLKCFRFHYSIAWMFFLYVCLCITLSPGALEARREHWIPWSCIYRPKCATRQMLGFEPGFSKVIFCLCSSFEWLQVCWPFLGLIIN